jgi:hypothetical protein
MPDYLDGVWPRETMHLMLSDDIDSDDVARGLICDHEIACVAMMMLPTEWSVCAQDHYH